MHMIIIHVYVYIQCGLNILKDTGIVEMFSCRKLLTIYADSFGGIGCNIFTKI